MIVLPDEFQDDREHRVGGLVKLPDHAIVLAPGEHFLVCLVPEFMRVLREFRVRFQDWRLLLF